MRRFLKADTTGQLLELVPADDQLAGLAVNVTQARLSRDDPVETAGGAGGRRYRGADETALTS